MTDPVGELTTATSYSGGYAYATQQTGFNVFGESMGQVVEIPSGGAGAAMGADFAFTNIYEGINGTLLKTSYPSGGGLPAETVTNTTTTALDLPSIVAGLNGYAEGTSYTAYGQVDQVTLGAGSDEADITDTYDPHTGDLTNQLVTRSVTTPADVDSTSYTYNDAGMTTAETDERLGSTASEETQCFTYTTQQELSQAWTATDNCAATPTTTSHSTVGDNLGTASEYDQSYTYNAASQRLTQTALDLSAGTFATTQYSYSATQPNALTGTSTTGAITASTSYGYNDDGQQNTRTTSLGNQTLSWNNLGQLTSVSTGSTTDASYIYGPDGSLFAQTDGSSTTLYLPGEQITDAGGTITGVRYYALPGGATAVRTGSGNSYYFEVPADQHGTNTLYLNYTAQTPTWRQYDPSGNPRGTAVTWIDNRGFLDDVDDAASALTDIGARWYDPATASFISLDPDLETADPAQINGYAYAADNPVSNADPTGLSAAYATNGGSCDGDAAACASSVESSESTSVGVYQDPGMQNDLFVEDGTSTYRIPTNSGLKVNTENVDAENQLNGLLGQQGNLYSGNLAGGGSDSGMIYVSTYEGGKAGDPVPDFLRLSYEDGELTGVLRVDLYSPTASKGTNSLFKAVEAKINGRQADATVVRAADEEQAEVIANGAFRYPNGDNAEVQQFGDLFAIGRAGDINPLVNPLIAPPVASGPEGDCACGEPNLPGMDPEDPGDPEVPIFDF
jgi:RHS repeat-associated protein